MATAHKAGPIGVVIIDKPTGITSSGVVAKVRKRLGLRRVGHTGTLDPLATGVLPICVGEATKLVPFLTAEDKVYTTSLRLGIETDTWDAEGKVTAEASIESVTREQVETALARFRGPQQQVPPMFSAIKQNGIRLHKLARAGVEVVRPPRSVEIYELTLLAFTPPMLSLRIHCSKGTYIRSIANDLGRELACGAHVAELRREQVGAFSLDMACTLEELDSHRLLSPGEVLHGVPHIAVDKATARSIRDGKPLGLELMNHVLGNLAAVTNDSGDLLAMIRRDGNRIRYERVFIYALT